jgi:lantibiotic modifying enzyme
MQWKPIIEDHVFKSAITDKLNSISNVIIEQIDKFPNPGLLDGKAGISIFFSYLDKYTNTDNYSDIINDLIIDSFSSINNGFNFPSYCSGISGILWTIDHLKTEGVIEADDYCDELIPFIEERMLAFAAEANFDYLHGAIGIGLYLLNCTTETNFPRIQQLIDLLEEKGIKENNTIKWVSILNRETQQNVYNLSLSHGMSSTIIFLNAVLKKYPGNKQVSTLSAHTINYLLSQKDDRRENQSSRFPSHVDIDTLTAHTGDRLAWCYGDLGNAIALYNAGIVFHKKELIDEAVQVMIHASKQTDLNKNFVKDAGVCHGTAGIAHIFNRFYQATGDETFRRSAVYWIEKTLEMAVFKDGLAGYKTHRNGEKSNWINEISLLEGVAGIGLVLLSTISPDEPRWDKCLLLS